MSYIYDIKIESYLHMYNFLTDLLRNKIMLLGGHRICMLRWLNL